MTTDLTHAVGVLQAAYTILLALAFGEAFKQFVTEKGPIDWSRFPSLCAFVLMIFPFFHGMSRYLFNTYMHGGRLGEFSGFLMFDGIVFVLLSAFFFVMSRSLLPSHWKRFYRSLLLLLLVDSVWIVVCAYRGIHLEPWLVLNGILGGVLLSALWFFRRFDKSRYPPWICAATTLVTTIAGYVNMQAFYFPP